MVRLGTDRVRGGGAGAFPAVCHGDGCVGVGLGGDAVAVIFVSANHGSEEQSS